MSKPVTEKAFVMAWPGSGLPNTTQSRIAHGAKTRPATSPTTRHQPKPPRTRLSPPMTHATTAQASAEQDRLVAGQRGQADQDAEREDARSVSRPPRGSRTMRVISRAGGERERRERHRRVGQGRVEQQRQVDGRRQAGAEGQRPRPPERQLALRRDIGGEPPGQDRDDRADQDGRPLGRREGRPEERHRDRREEASAAAARPRRPARGNTSGGVW